MKSSIKLHFVVALLFLAAPEIANAQDQPEMIYAQAIASKTNAAKSLSLLKQAISAGIANPGRVLSEPAFADLLHAPESRRKIRELLEKADAESLSVMIHPAEQGERLSVHGQVLDAETGGAVAGARLYLFQTDAAGLYAPEYSHSGAGSDNPRLFAYIKTGGDGRFRLETVMPGSYPNSQVSRHVHYVATADDFQRSRKEFIIDLEPRPTESVRRHAQRNGWPVVAPKRVSDSQYTVDVIIKMRRKSR